MKPSTPKAERPPSTRHFNRRRFLRQTAAASTALAFAAPFSQSALGANERLNVALIGCNWRGGYVANGIGNAGARIVCLCDLDKERMEMISSKILTPYTKGFEATKVKRVTEMRKVFDDPNIDAVIVATPDHWHALASIRAVQAGKDVYVEKPHSHNIYESRQMIAAARKYNRIMQVGAQNRSGAYNLSAREYIRSGKLGNIHLVKVYNLKKGDAFHLGQPGTPPPGFDWDRWLGPAPQRPFHEQIYKQKWRHFWDYCGGDLADDGAHQTDLALMLMGDPGLPRSVSSAGGRLAHKGDDSEVPDLLVSTFEFDGFVLTLEHSNYPEYMEKTTTSIRQGDAFPFWLHNSTRIELYGAKEMMVAGVHGGGWQATVYPWEVTAQQFGRPCDDEHYANFVECVKSRKRPNGDVETLHQSGCLLHMANVAHRVGNKKLWFDAARERFDSADANALLRRTYRPGYAVPEKV